MLCHLKYPLKAQIDAQCLRLWWEETAVTASRGLSNSYTLTSGKKYSSTASTRTITEHGFGIYCIEEKIPETCLTFVWTMTLRENHMLDIECLIKSDSKTKAEDIIENIESTLIVPIKHESWFTAARSGTFKTADTQDITVKEKSVSFCLALESAQGSSVPSILFESLINKHLPFVSFIKHDSDPEEGAVRKLGFCLTKEHIKQSSIMRTRIIVTARPDILKTFVTRNRSQNPLLTPWRTFACNPAQGQHIKTLLVNLPWQKDGISGVRAGSRWSHLKDESEDRYLPFPFFLAHAKSLLTSCGYEALLLDAIAKNMTESDFAEYITQNTPGLVAAEISTPSFDNDLAMLAKLPSETKIVLCGPVCMLEDKDFLNEHPQIDFILTNEYEESLLELVSVLENGENLAQIKGLIWKDAEGKIQNNGKRELTDINNLPWPERATVPYFDYWDLVGDIPEPSAQMLSSRGCPYNCAFCLWPQLMYQGRNYRTRDENDIVDEMEYLVHVLGYKSVYFDDDTTNIGRDRWMKICSEIIRRGLNRVPWGMMARADLMDAEMLSVFKAAGLHAVKYGVESTTQSLVDTVGKDMDLRKTFRAIELTRAKNIKVHLTFMFGLPGETQDTIEKTINDALRLNPHSLQFSINTPYPGTRIHKTLNEQGHIVENSNYSSYDGHYNGVIHTEHLSPTQLLEAKDRAYAMWQNHQRSRRGFFNNARRFLSYSKKYSLARALKVAAVYIYSRLIIKGFFVYERMFWPLRDRSCTGITINADNFIRGNVNSGRHPFGRGVIIDGGHNYAYAEYEFVVVRRTEYNFYVKYANNGYRPVEIYMDGILVKKRSMLEKTDGWNPAQAKLIKELTITLDKGRHHLKIHSSGLIPHIQKFVLRASDQDREVMNEFPEALFARVVRKLWDKTFASGLKALSPRRIVRAFRHDFLELKEQTDTHTALMLAGISQGQTALVGPEHAVIDLTNQCNQNCIGCWIHSPRIKQDETWQHNTLSTETIERLLDDLAQSGTKRVRFTGGGEPFMHPDILSIIAYAKEKKLHVALTTNLSLLDKEKIGRLIQAGLDELSVSLWAATPETFALTNPDSNTNQFKTTLNNLEYLASIPYAKPTLALCFVINKLNAHEIKDMYKLAKTMKADKAYFTLMAGLETKDTDDLFLSPEQKEKLTADANAVLTNAKELDHPKLEFFEDGFLRRLKGTGGECDKDKLVSVPCYMGWYFTRILADGTVVPCCKAVDKKMGNINESSFIDIWFGNRYNEFRWKAKTLPKTDPYFEKADCFNQCDNLMHNIMIEQMLESSAD